MNHRVTPPMRIFPQGTNTFKAVMLNESSNEFEKLLTNLRSRGLSVKVLSQRGLERSFHLDV